MITACQVDKKNENSSLAVAQELNLIGKWASPCIAFDGASVRKVHEFKETGDMIAELVEYSDKQCGSRKNRGTIGRYPYHLTKLSKGLANIDLQFTDHKEYGAVSADESGMRLVYGTDMVKQRDALKLSEMKYLKVWTKIK